MRLLAVMVMDVVLLEAKVLVRLTGATCLSLHCRNTRKLMARQALGNNMLLAARGWKVVRVPYFTYNEAPTLESKAELLRRLLSAHLLNRE